VGGPALSGFNTVSVWPRIRRDLLDNTSLAQGQLPPLDGPTSSGSIVSDAIRWVIRDGVAACLRHIHPASRLPKQLLPDLTNALGAVRRTLFDGNP